jgi:hypothetical protein
LIRSGTGETALSIEPALQNHGLFEFFEAVYKFLNE